MPSCTYLSFSTGLNYGSFRFPNCSAAAAGEGHIEVLEWLFENGCPWDAHACYTAARGGHLGVLRYLRDNGCEWDERKTCLAAAGGRHIEVLQFLRANCVWSVEGSHCQIVDNILDATENSCR